MPDALALPAPEAHCARVRALLDEVAAVRRRLEASLQPVDHGRPQPRLPYELPPEVARA